MIDRIYFVKYDSFVFSERIKSKQKVHTQQALSECIVYRVIWNTHNVKSERFNSMCRLLCVCTRFSRNLFLSHFFVIQWGFQNSAHSFTVRLFDWCWFYVFITFAILPSFIYIEELINLIFIYANLNQIISRPILRYSYLIINAKLLLHNVFPENIIDFFVIIIVKWYLETDKMMRKRIILLYLNDFARHSFQI